MGTSNWEITSLEVLLFAETSKGDIHGYDITQYTIVVSSGYPNVFRPQYTIVVLIFSSIIPI